MKDYQRGERAAEEKAYNRRESHMILVSNRGPSLGFLSGASDTPGTQEASRVFLSKDINQEGDGHPRICKLSLQVWFWLIVEGFFNRGIRGS